MHYSTSTDLANAKSDVGNLSGLFLREQLIITELLFIFLGEAGGIIIRIRKPERLQVC